MYPGAGPVDVMINGGDGYLYVGSSAGALYRLDPRTGQAEWLGKPTAAARMPGLKVWRDGLLLGVVGDDKAASVFTYDRERRAFRVLGPIIAEDGTALHRTHDLAIMNDDTIFVAETDAPDRSGYLWECRISV
jgi:outer membrane protein assembly factor BamB